MAVASVVTYHASFLRPDANIERLMQGACRGFVARSQAPHADYGGSKRWQKADGCTGTALWVITVMYAPHLLQALPLIRPELRSWSHRDAAPPDCRPG